MKRVVLTFNIIALFIMLSSCSNTNDNPSSVVGTWKLTSWTINIPLDINNDAIESFNLLEEISCSNNETLVFESNGTMYSNESFNHKIDIALLNNMLGEYIFNIECDNEGIVSFATSYSQNSDSTVFFNDKESVIIDNQLIQVFENAVNIYNTDFIEVLSTKDLTLVYTKQ